MVKWQKIQEFNQKNIQYLFQNLCEIQIAEN